ncbi:MAG: sigma-E factor negative regulatory protein [Gammaproteobacteria bacterium]|nr:sigma-E factor negative regulatory protein [Gammaproteobacteria bacterium]MBU6508855.1 sigma-E factor negative regulatory protein [Gammaproteobacteria bacterium]MDE1983478.1 sigma-E factor negative regulatory protein [Gammaproteobacteria bacterium]MDE2108162.1 sigma-E factor negative regulatory protein [Gammaproteobacteria bacterium]MDE2460193.1 sigma-E factor negative regulatory protein [Gammaproteobacteria bacterium]
MTERLREQVSALADDELPESEHELLVRRFAADRYLCLCWERYHLIGEAMRKSLPQVDTRGFADRIMQLLGRDAEEQQGHTRRAPRVRVAASITAAVCVAVVALAAVRFNAHSTHLAVAPSEIVPPASALQTTPVGYGINTAAWNGNTPEVQAELSNYIINHNEISAALGQQDPLPYFYITAYDVSRTARGAAPAGLPQVPPRKR